MNKLKVKVESEISQKKTRKTLKLFKLRVKLKTTTKVKLNYSRKSKEPNLRSKQSFTGEIEKNLYGFLLGHFEWFS